jgi:hypothetical protein
MIRALIWTPILLVVGVLAGVYLAYGQVDPCRALAVEQTRRSVAPAVIAGPLARMTASQMSSTACARGLLRSWRNRIVLDAL